LWLHHRRCVVICSEDIFGFGGGVAVEQEGFIGVGLLVSACSCIKGGTFVELNADAEQFS